MGRADLGDPDAEAGMLAHDRAGGAGVVEVDVREQEVADVGQLEPALGEPVLAAAAASSPGRSRRAPARPAVSSR